MEPQDGLDRRAGRSDRPPGEPLDDPGRLGPSLELADVLLAPPAVHRHDRDEAAARNEPDEQQPPLEFRHQAGRIGPPAGLPRRAYTRPR